MVMSMSNTYVKCQERSLPVSVLLCRVVLWVACNQFWMLKCLIILAWIFKFLQAYSDFRGIYQISLSFCYKPGGLGMLNCTSGNAS
jgi:hypothetical protein